MTKALVRVPLEAGLDVGREIVIAEPTSEQSCYCVRSIPAFSYGLAVGDTIRVVDKESGKYDVVARGGQVTIRVFVSGSLNRPDVNALIDSVVQAQGQYEIGKNDTATSGASLLLLSLDAQIGFPKIESLLRAVQGPDVKWEYGNVYAPDGRPLNWWVH